MRENNPPPLVEISGLCKWFGDFSALFDINLSVDSGEKVVVCGPSGSGKSTMIRCINQLEEHQAGTITVDGKEGRPGMKNIAEIRREYILQRVLDPSQNAHVRRRQDIQVGLNDILAFGAVQVQGVG